MKVKTKFFLSSSSIFLHHVEKQFFAATPQRRLLVGTVVVNVVVAIELRSENQIFIYKSKEISLKLSVSVNVAAPCLQFDAHWIKNH